MLCKFGLEIGKIVLLYCSLYYLSLLPFCSCCWQWWLIEVRAIWLVFFDNKVFFLQTEIRLFDFYSKNICILWSLSMFHLSTIKERLIDLFQITRNSRVVWIKSNFIDIHRYTWIVINKQLVLNSTNELFKLMITNNNNNSRIIIINKQIEFASGNSPAMSCCIHN